MKKLVLVTLLVVLAAAVIAAFAPADTCTVTAGELVLRRVPDGRVYATLHKGDVLAVTGSYQREPYPGFGVWMEVRKDDMVGWVDQRYCASSVIGGSRPVGPRK